MKAVPWKAVKILKTKKATRLGASAVPMLEAQNNTETILLIYMVVSC
jgi:hypothetical protein